MIIFIYGRRNIPSVNFLNNCPQHYLATLFGGRVRQTAIYENEGTEESATTWNVTAAIPTSGRRTLRAWRKTGGAARMTHTGEADTILRRGDRTGATADQTRHTGSGSMKYGGSGALTTPGDVLLPRIPATN
jgi:hypothetical protein